MLMLTPFDIPRGSYTATTLTLKMSDTFDLPPIVYRYRRITKLPTTNQIPLDARTPQELADLSSRITGLCATRIEPVPIPPPAVGPYAYYVITRGAEIGVFNNL